MPQQRKTRRRLGVWHWIGLLCAGVICQNQQVFSIEASTERRRLQQNEAAPVLPTIFTFYSQINDVVNPAGMSHTAHSNLLRFWIKAWTRAGWNPIVLDERHAKAHPEYAKFQSLAEQSGAGSYNQLCFLRWLAMAQVGGGWMSDYDVFPLHDFRRDGFYLPNNGILTIHNRLCPSLVSGTAQEWYRMANILIPYAADHQINSDQKVLAEIWNQFPQAPFIRDLSVTQTVLNATTWRQEHCDEYTPPSMRCVHFAHTPVKKAIKEGKLPPGTTVQHRAEIATRFMDRYLEKCGDKITTFQHDPSLLSNSAGNQKKQTYPGYSS